MTEKDNKTDTDATYRAICTCGWSVERNESDSNLSPESNQSIRDSVADAHQFYHDFADDGHSLYKETESTYTKEK